MKKKIISLLLVLILIIGLTGCDKNPKSEEKNNNSKTEETNTNKVEEPEKIEEPSTLVYGFDLEKMKPNLGGEIYSKTYEVEMAIQGKVTSVFYGEIINRVSTYDEDLTYAIRIFSYCKSIASDGKVYQSVGRFTDPNNSAIKEIKSAKEAEEISSTFTWSIKIEGHWTIITIAGDKVNRQSIGVRLVQLKEHK